MIPNLYSKIRFIIDRFKSQEISEIDEFTHLRGRDLAIDETYLLNKFETNLQLFISICQTYGISPVLMTQASRFTSFPDTLFREIWTLDDDFGIKYSHYKAIFDEFNEAIKSVGDTNNVLVIDLAKTVPQESSFIYDAIHFNDNGSKFVAEVITNELLASNLIRR